MRPQAHLEHVDGVMLGRAAYHDPGLLGMADRRLFDAARRRHAPRRWSAICPICAPSWPAGRACRP